LPAKLSARLSPVEHHPAPLRNKIITALRGAIETGVLQPGARLVERDLCEQLNVSRTSLREALRELEAEGVLLQTGARGLSVAVIDREEASNAYRIRAVLEALVVAQFIEHADEREVRNLVKDADALKAAYRSGDVGRIVVAKRQFHDRICTGADNALAFDIINRLVLRTSSLRSRSLARKARQAQSIEEIDAIVDAIRARDVEVARRAAAAHVEHSMASVFSVFDEPGPGGETAGEKPARRRPRAALPAG
jgi:DNA-binding GntR family transcriptional regulator